jgi:hypothetical protein
MLAIQGMGKALMTMVLVGASALATGCAIHTQGPVKEVAYDFSDAALYDRAYAVSPQYETRDHEYAIVEGEAVAPVSAEVEADDAVDAMLGEAKMGEAVLEAVQ